MPEHNLFRKVPPIELVDKIFKPIGINIYDLPTQFTKQQATTYKWDVDVLEELIPYYVPSMLARFFQDNYPLSTLTVFRQLIKVHELEFKTVESMSDGKKTNIYHISRPIGKILEHPIKISFN